MFKRLLGSICAVRAMQLGDQPCSCQADPSKRSIVIQITDNCPQCEADHLDIQALTWAKVIMCICTMFNW